VACFKITEALLKIIEAYPAPGAPIKKGTLASAFFKSLKTA
jgi:hypothetical protein